MEMSLLIHVVVLSFRTGVGLLLAKKVKVCKCQMSVKSCQDRAERTEGANLVGIKTLHFITTSPRRSRADSDNQGDHRKLDRLSQG